MLSGRYADGAEREVGALNGNLDAIHPRDPSGIEQVRQNQQPASVRASVDCDDAVFVPADRRGADGVPRSVRLQRRIEAIVQHRDARQVDSRVPQGSQRRVPVEHPMGVGEKRARLHVRVDIQTRRAVVHELKVVPREFDVAAGHDVFDVQQIDEVQRRRIDELVRHAVELEPDIQQIRVLAQADPVVAPKIPKPVHHCRVRRQRVLPPRHAEHRGIPARNVQLGDLREDQGARHEGVESAGERQQIHAEERDRETDVIGRSSAGASHTSATAAPSSWAALVTARAVCAANLL